MSIINSVNSSLDIKRLSEEELAELADELRCFLVESVSKTGGHLASNLGAVELTLALHRVYNTEKDRIVFDVGHQSYTHKIITGRRDRFDTLRQYGGLSGFPKPDESRDDAFIAGHASNSVSVAVGMAKARTILHEDYDVVAVIGDGALTGGLAYEGLAAAAASREPMVIVLNDNNMSIDANVGGTARLLQGMRIRPGYIRFKRWYRDVFMGMPAVYSFNHDLKEKVKDKLLPVNMFSAMGLNYLGPVDGHNLKELETVFRLARDTKEPVLVHVLTQKGRGVDYAEKHPEIYHGVGPFNALTGELSPAGRCFSDRFGETICSLAEEKPTLVAITAAMTYGTGLDSFAARFPARFTDVGIAEGNATSMAAGMAKQGLVPVFAVYSSFLQRGFDQVLHDVCIQNLPVVFALDRAGLVGADGETHQGIFDLSFLGCIPNMTILAPKNAWELEDCLSFAFSFGGPIAIRYPRGQAYRGLEEFRSPVEFGKGEILYEESETAILAVGSMVSTGEHIRSKLKAEGHPCTLANGRFVKPIDTELLERLAEKHCRVITMEENVLNGGFGMSVSDWFRRNHPEVDVMNIALPDAYVEHGDVSVLREHLGIDSDSVLRKMKERYGF